MGLIQGVCGAVEVLMSLPAQILASILTCVRSCLPSWKDRIAWHGSPEVWSSPTRMPWASSFQQIPNHPGRDQAQRGQGPPAGQCLSVWDPVRHAFVACEETKTENESPKTSTPLQGHWWL